jgi:hypothetical protein
MGLKRRYSVSNGARYFLDRGAYEYLLSVWTKNRAPLSPHPRDLPKVHWRKNIQFVYKQVQKIAGNSVGNLEVLSARGRCKDQNYQRMLMNIRKNEGHF